MNKALESVAGASGGGSHCVLKLSEQGITICNKEREEEKKEKRSVFIKVRDSFQLEEGLPRIAVELNCDSYASCTWTLITS